MDLFQDFIFGNNDRIFFFDNLILSFLNYFLLNERYRYRFLSLNKSLHYFFNNKFNRFDNFLNNCMMHHLFYLNLNDILVVDRFILNYMHSSISFFDSVNICFTLLCECFLNKSVYRSVSCICVDERFFDMIGVFYWHFIHKIHCYFIV